MEDLKRRSGVLLWRPMRAARRHLVGLRMLRNRQASGIPQAALAKRLGVPIWRLSRLEHGLDPIPACLIAKVVGMLTAHQPSGTLRGDHAGSRRGS
jgi:Helix-turn-helix